MTPAMIKLCRALLDNGIRTLAFRFDGSGDSGSLEEWRIFATPQLSLLELEEEMNLDNPDEVEECSFSVGDMAFAQNYPDSAMSKKALPMVPTFKLIKSIEQSYSSLDSLEDLAYDALLHFDGDWVNNAGGYGIVGIDLQTGEFRIWGYQRIEDTEVANSGGTLKIPTDEIFAASLPPGPSAPQSDPTQFVVDQVQALLNATDEALVADLVRSMLEPSEP